MAIEMNQEGQRALRIAHETTDAYSADAWGPVRWVEAALMLVEMGLTDREVEGVLRSKLTRWARDNADDRPLRYLGELLVLVREWRDAGRLRELCD